MVIGGWVGEVFGGVLSGAVGLGGTASLGQEPTVGHYGVPSGLWQLSNPQLPW